MLPSKFVKHGRQLQFSVILAVAGVLVFLARAPFGISVAHAQNSVVVARGVQTGLVVFGNGGVTQVNGVTSTVTLGTAVDATKAFVHCSFSTTRGGPDTHPTCQLTDTTVVLTLGATAAIAAAAHTTVRWYVVELEGDVLVQRGVASFTSGQTEPGAALVSLGTPVACATSFVLTSERMNSTSGTLDEQWQVAATLTGSGGAAPRAACTSGTTSSLELHREESGTALTVAWQVIRIDGITVQRGRSCIGPNDATCPLGTGATAGLSQSTTISAVTTAKAFVLTTQRGGTGIAGNEGDYRVRTDFSSTTQLRFTRNNTNTATTDRVFLTWEVVSLNDSGRVERNAFASPVLLPAASATVNSGSFTNVYQARTVPFFSWTNGSNAATAHATSTVLVQTNQSTLTFSHTTTSGVTQTIAWQAVEFFGCTTDPTLCHVSVSALSGTTTDTASARISWWPVHFVSGNPCFTAGVSPSTCNVMVVRAGNGASITFAPTNGTSYTPGFLTGGGACSSTNGTATNPCVVHNGGVTAGAVATFATESNLKNNGTTTYVYRVYARTGAVTGCATAPCWVSLSTSLSQVSVTPRIYSATTGGQQWVYHPSGGAALNSPIADTSNKLYASNSNNKVFSIDTSTGVELSLPVITPGPALGYPTWWLAGGGGTPQVVVGDQKGYVTSFNGTTGKRLWTRRIHTDPEDATLGNIQAAIVVQDQAFSNAAFTGHYSTTYSYTGDVLFATTRNITPVSGPTANQNKRNKVYALRATDGTQLWAFDPNNVAGDCSPQLSMDIVVGTPWVDYFRNSLYVPSEDGPTAGQPSLWILDTRGPTSGGGASANCRGTLKSGVSGLLDNDFTIWQPFDAETIQFQTANGLLRAYDADTLLAKISGSTVITAIVSVSPNFLIKGSAWQDFDKSLEGKLRMYFVTQNGGVWCVDENAGGTDFVKCPSAEWPINPIYQHSTGSDGVATGATPLAAGMLLDQRFWTGGGDNGGDHFGRGTLFQLSTTNGALEKTFVVDSSSTLGDISVAEAADALFVGSSAGRIYRINLSGPNGSLP